MNLIRYHAPELSTWPTLDRWSNLRDELNSLFELPFLSNLSRQDLFSGWSPALDLYQNSENVVAALELPAKLFGKERFKVGDRIQFASRFYTHCRSYRVDWEDEFTLARQR